MDVSTPTFRPATLEDAALAADLMTASYPAIAQDPEVTRYRWEHPRANWARGRFIAELGGRPIAFLAWLHGHWDQRLERHCEVEVWLDQARLESELLTFLWMRIGAEAEADGARVLEARAAEDEPEKLDVLERIGYERDRVEKVWALDLKANGRRLKAEAHAARAKAASTGIEMRTLAGWGDPNGLRKLHGLDELTRRDIPVTYPVVPETYESFLDRVNGPDRISDRFWIAFDDDSPVAMSYLRFPPVRGDVWTGYTCCHPDYRGRGLARAVKLQTLAQASGLGIPAVHTDNDSENGPMLHINEALGYQLRTRFVSLLKRVKT